MCSLRSYQRLHICREKCDINLPSTLDHSDHVLVIWVEWMIKRQECKHGIPSLFSFYHNFHLTTLSRDELGRFDDDLVLFDYLRLKN